MRRIALEINKNSKRHGRSNCNSERKIKVILTIAVVKIEMIVEMWVEMLAGTSSSLHANSRTPSLVRF